MVVIYIHLLKVASPRYLYDSGHYDGSRRQVISCLSCNFCVLFCFFHRTSVIPEIGHRQQSCRICMHLKLFGSMAYLGFKIQNNCHKSLEYFSNTQKGSHKSVSPPHICVALFFLLPLLCAVELFGLWVTHSHITTHMPALSMCENVPKSTPQSHQHSAQFSRVCVCGGNNMSPLAVRQWQSLAFVPRWIFFYSRAPKPHAHA